MPKFGWRRDASPNHPKQDSERAFRLTRTGVPFSPWFSRIGVPLHAPADFLFHRQVQEAMTAQVHPPAHDSDDPAVDAFAPPLLESSTALQCDEPPASLGPPTRAPSCCLETAAEATSDAFPIDEEPARGESKAKRLLSALRSLSPFHSFDISRTKKAFHRSKHKTEQRAKKRAREADAADPDMNRVMKNVSFRYVAHAIGPQLSPSDGAAVSPPTSPATDCASASPAALVSMMSIKMEHTNTAKEAFTGVFKQPTQADLLARTKEDFERMNFRYVEWDGKISIVILDHTGTYVIAVLAGRPNDATWEDDVNKALQDEFDKARAEFHFSKEPNRRGDDVEGISVGISFGGGQLQPGNLVQTSQANERIARRLLAHPATRRIAGFGNAALQKFQPLLYKFYDKTLTAICERNPALVRNYTNNVFACATFNVGSHTVTCRHFDHLNLAYGMCAVTALGDYDPRRGGHIALWELRMLVEFPPSSTIIIPSAVVSHSNTDVQPGERRYSFTQYSAGGLFRWTAAGHMTLKNLQRQGGRLHTSGKERWDRGIELLSKWEGLRGWWERRGRDTARS